MYRNTSPLQKKPEQDKAIPAVSKPQSANKQTPKSVINSAIKATSTTVSKPQSANKQTPKSVISHNIKATSSAVSKCQSANKERPKSVINSAIKSAPTTVSEPQSTNKQTPKSFISSGIKAASSIVSKTQSVNKQTPKSIINSQHKTNKTSERIVSTTSPSLSGKVRSSSLKDNSSLSQPITGQKTVSKQFTDFYKPVSSNTKDLHFQKDVEKFTSEFKDLTETILKLATSDEPLEPRTLELLLSREIENSLGSTINNPELSQTFIEATRNLLDSLISIYEDGGINPHILPSQRFARPTFLQAMSATTVCYRDQYLKELVMNMLHRMCTTKVEEEISKVSSHIHNLSVASRQRIHAIRDIVRSEAGIEPEAFHRLEQELENLQRTFSENKQKVLEATNKVEKVVSEHLVRRLDSLQCLQIPCTAQEALKKGKDEAGIAFERMETDNNSSKGCCQSHSGCQLDENFSVNYENPSFQNNEKNNKNAKMCCTDEGKYCLVSLPEDEINMNENTKSSFESRDDIIEQIRPEIEKIVIDELSKVREKSAMVLNDIGEGSYEDPNCSFDQFNGTCMGCHYQNRNNYFDIDIKQTEISVEPFNVDLFQTEKDITEKFVENCTGLNLVDGDCCKLLVQSVNHVLPKSNKNQFQNNCVKNEEYQTSKITLYNTALKEPFCSDPDLIISPNSVCQVNNEESLCNSNTLKPPIPMKERSKWWFGDESLARVIVETLKLAYQNVDNSYNQTIDVSNEIRENVSEKETNEFANDYFDFTIKEIADILKGISHEIIEFPSHFLSVDSGKKREILEIISVVENSLNGFYPCDDDFLPLITEEEQLLLSVEKISNTFFWISNKLHLAQAQLREQPISVLSPPKRFTNILAYLASTDYFKHIFISVAIDGNLNNNESEECNYRKYQFNNSTQNDDGIVTSPNSDIEKICLNVPGQGSSVNIQPIFEDSQTPLSITTDLRQDDNIKKSFSFEKNYIDGIQKHLENFNHCLKPQLSEITIQNTSDIFLYLSIVLNDIPKRLKMNNLVTLNPPSNLIKVLNILYRDETFMKSYVDKGKSFESLTVQNASDFFLTLSKCLQDASLKLKNKLIMDTNLPPSIIQAINILIPPQNSEILSEKEEDSELVTCGEDTNESEDNFIDALEILGEN